MSDLASSLITAFLPWTYQQAWRVAHTTGLDGDELVQQAALVLIELAQRAVPQSTPGRTRASFYGLLRKTLPHRLHRHAATMGSVVRRPDKVPVPWDSPLPEQPFRAQHTPETILLARESWPARQRYLAHLERRLYAALTRVTRKQRVALVLRFGLGEIPPHTLAEMRQVLRVRDWAVRQQISRGLASLRREMQRSPSGGTTE